ncbi:MAG TPA: nucleotide sugar dehydrogenase [Actinomycetota bacterium]|nr:nucleotide sugar dehydrogenase [Actinomycetota bacterium]
MTHPSGAPSASWTELIARFRSRDATVAVVGLGYVGLPVALGFAREGFAVLGVDADPKRVEAIRSGTSYLRDVSDDELAEALAAARFQVDTSYEAMSGADAILICVPTPLFEGTPDLTPIKSAGEALGEVLTKGTLVVLESTTYPGTTEEILMPLLGAHGLEAGTDFLLAFSPERIDPGNDNFSFTDIPKIVGGIDALSTEAAEALYSQVVPKVVKVPGTREAEMSKLIENTFRHVNIALVNELAVYAHDLGIDIWESIGAAATKPFGFMPFWPGPGWGGHCIPLDPAYLSWRVRKDRAHEIRFVELAHMVNAEMPRHVVERVSLLLNDMGKAVKGAKVLGVGVAYKGGTEDRRGSPGLIVLSELRKRGADVSYLDPLVPEAIIAGENQHSIVADPDTIAAQDLLVVLAPQIEVPWEALERSARMILDCCNAYGRTGGKIVRL